MGRRSKDGRYVNVNISIEAVKALEEHCRDSGQTKTTAVERAILACYGGRAAPGVTEGGAACANGRK